MFITVLAEHHAVPHATLYFSKDPCDRTHTHTRAESVVVEAHSLVSLEGDGTPVVIVDASANLKHEHQRFTRPF